MVLLEGGQEIGNQDGVNSGFRFLDSGTSERM